MPELPSRLSIVYVQAADPSNDNRTAPVVAVDTFFVDPPLVGIADARSNKL